MRGTPSRCSSACWPTSAHSGWLTDLVELVGWQFSGRPRGPKLYLAALVADPGPPSKSWLGALATDADLLDTLPRQQPT